MKNIMIVDDDDYIQELLKNRLEANGYKVSLAEDGLQALSQIKNKRPDMILLDVYMPHLDGLSFFHELSSDRELRDIPVLVMTGIKNMEDVFASTRVAKFITKPFDSKELLKTIKSCVGR